MQVIPFSLELLALRRLTAAAFGTIMSLEPAAEVAMLGQTLRMGSVARHRYAHSQPREIDMSAAEATTVVDDERVRITTWTFGADGDNTGWHVHEHDYVVVPVTGGTFAVTAPDGTHQLTQHAGSPYLGKAGTEHDVASVGGTSAVFVEIELKR